VERAPALSPADRERIAAYVSRQAPHPQHPLDVEFANGLQLIGYDLDSPSAHPGQPITITWYWHATQDLDDNWKLFTHVADATGESRLNQDGVGTLRDHDLYQPGRWEPGQYIKDVQNVLLPADWNSPRATFFLGLWNGDQHRLAIRRGPNDGDNRVRAATIDVASNAPPTEQEPREFPTATLLVPHANGAITIDGNLDEPAWVSAARTAPFANTIDGRPVPTNTTARILWDEANLYLAFDVGDDFVQNTIREHDGELWTQDVVEMMIDPGGHGANYFELQVSPTGTVFDTRYDAPGRPATPGDTAWESHLRTHVTVRGTANDESPDHGYLAEIAIPWSAFHAGEPPADPPHALQEWRANFYFFDKRPGTEGMRSGGWSPTLTGTFHAPARFGQLRFQPAAGAPPAVPPTAPGAIRMRTPELVLPPGQQEAVRALARPRPLGINKQRVAPQPH
jgi:hypothetical protein